MGSAHGDGLDAQHGQQLAQLLLQVGHQAAHRRAVILHLLGIKDVQNLGFGLAKALPYLTLLR